MAEEKKILTEFLKGRGMKVTSQRETILDCFLACEQHLSPEEMFHRIRGKHPNIGRATVYRTLKLLAEAQLAETVEFGDGATRFEHKHGHRHHDHLICTECGTSVEFAEPELERLQDEVAAANGFTPTRHRLEIFGVCAKCAKKGRGKASTANGQ